MLEPQFTTTLKDGTDILVRLVDPCDKACIAKGFEQLSARSRQLRFFSPMNTLSDAQLSHLTTVDNVNHVVVAASGTQGDEPSGIGLGRYIRLVEEPDVAEMAITVTDAYQGRGLGSILLDLLIARARENHIRTLRGYVLESNQPMIKMLERRHARRQREDNGSSCFELDLIQ